eukprot:5802421-Pyramimonas_sp.AAC.3
MASQSQWEPEAEAPAGPSPGQGPDEVVQPGEPADAEPHVAVLPVQDPDGAGGAAPVPKAGPPPPCKIALQGWNLYEKISDNTVELP